jgi:hypothetical protein
MSYSRVSGLLRVFTRVLQAGPRPPPRARACPTAGPWACFASSRVSYRRARGLLRALAHVLQPGLGPASRPYACPTTGCQVCRACSLACSGQARGLSRVFARVFGQARGLSRVFARVFRARPRSVMPRERRAPGRPAVWFRPCRMSAPLMSGLPRGAQPSPPAEARAAGERVATMARTRGSSAGSPAARKCGLSSDSLVP